MTFGGLGTQLPKDCPKCNTKNVDWDYNGKEKIYCNNCNTEFIIHAMKTKGGN